MRKLTMFVLLATSAVPAMASAQEEGGRQGREDRQAQRSDDRPRAERAERVERPERAPREERRQQVQVERQVQVQQPVQSERQVQVERRGRDVQVERQVREVQVERRDGERGREFGGRGVGEQDGQASRDERMQQYREQRQRRAEAGGQQPPVQDGSVVGRPVPGTNPVLVGRPAPENRDARIAHRDRRDGSYWTSSWRNDHRYDWRHHRDRHRSIFRIGFYYDPFGYSYNRFGIGSYMYPSYYRSNYWISDPWQYRLPPAYGPYRWVRYHNDALLIDTWNGEVVDVIYGFFW